MQAIDVIFFDLDGVVFDGTERFISVIGLRYPEEKVRDILSSSHSFGDRYRRGTITSDEYWIEFRKHIGATESFADLRQELMENFQPIKGTIQLIRDLREQYLGLNTFYFTNSPSEVTQYINTHQNNILTELFSYRGIPNVSDGSLGVNADRLNWLTNDEEVTIGYKKPSWGLVRSGLALAELVHGNFQGSLFVDNNEGNIAFIQQNGGNGLVFTNPETLRRDLFENYTFPEGQLKRNKEH